MNENFLKVFWNNISFWFLNFCKFTVNNSQIFRRISEMGDNRLKTGCQCKRNIFEFCGWTGTNSRWDWGSFDSQKL